MKIKILFLTLPLLLSSFAEARFRHAAYYGPGFYSSGPWRGGYWFHGAYANRAGWWWVVGPTWYYYPNPVYPYPESSPVYVVQVGNAPPPPPASAPGGEVVKTATPAAPPTANDGKPKAFSYYCEKTKAYYPVTATCADGWVATPVKAPN